MSDRSEVSGGREPSPRRVLLAAGGLLGLIGAWAAGAQWSAWTGLDNPEPTLLGLPAGGSRQLDSPPTRVVRRMVMVIADGLGVQVARELAGITKLGKSGVWATTRAAGPTYSGPSYTTWLTGLDPVDSGVRTNRYPRAVPLDSLLARARAAGLKTLSYEDGHPTPLGRLFGPHLGVALGREVSWLRALAAIGKVDLAILILDEVDSAGHVHGAASRAYQEAAGAVDRKVRALSAILDFDRDLLVVVNDHGHLPEGGHGGVEPPVRDLFVAARGAGLARGRRGKIAQRDLAPTLAVLLGLRPPGHNRGRLIDWALAADNEPGFLQGAFANQYLGRLRVEGHLARQHAARPPARRGVGARSLLRASVGNLERARRMARHVTDGLSTAVLRARRAELHRTRVTRGLAYGVLWLVALGGLLAARTRGWVKVGAAAWILPLCTVVVGYGALRLLGLRPSLSFNGVGWMLRFFAAAVIGAGSHLLLAGLLGLGREPRTRGRSLAGRLLAGALVLGGLALAATAVSPLVHDLLLPDLRLVASMFLLRLWFIAFASLAAIWLLLAGARAAR